MSASFVGSIFYLSRRRVFGSRCGRLLATSPPVVAENYSGADIAHRAEKWTEARSAKFSRKPPERIGKIYPEMKGNICPSGIPMTSNIFRRAHAVERNDLEASLRRGRKSA